MGFGSGDHPFFVDHHIPCPSCSLHSNHSFSFSFLARQSFLTYYCFSFPACVSLPWYVSLLSLVSSLFVLPLSRLPFLNCSPVPSALSLLYSPLPILSLSNPFPFQKTPLPTLSHFSPFPPCPSNTLRSSEASVPVRLARQGKQHHGNVRAEVFIFFQDEQRHVQEGPLLRLWPLGISQRAYRQQTFREAGLGLAKRPEI